jgi:DNA processing protein
VTETIQAKVGAPRECADVAAACALASVPGMGAAALARVAQAFGSLAAALQAGPAALAAKSDLRLRKEARDFLGRHPDLEKLGAWALSAARAAGARVLTPDSASYPALLRQIENPPAVLYVRGELAEHARRVALVGARAADEAALQLARELAEELAAAGVQIVSGGARGVDAAAHAGALWGGGSTVAVMGSGIDVAYPPENGPLFERIAEGGGALVSEFPPGTPSTRPNFPRRNRTIAGLSHATIVVRATAASGALITARHAAAQGRPIFAVPGDRADELTAGPDQLLSSGVAAPVRCAADVLRLLGWPVPEKLAGRTDALRATRQPAVQPPAPVPVQEALEGPALRVWELLDGARPLHVDVLANQAQLRPDEALRSLTELELKGLIHQRPGKYFLRSRGWS